MISMFLTNGMYLSFCFLCPAQSLLLVYPMWVHSQCGLEVLYLHFQLFRCRNLALNRDVFPTLEAGMGGCQHRGCLYAPHMSVHAPVHVHTPPYIHMPSILPCTSVCSPYTICFPYVMGTGGASLHPICLGSLLGASVHLSSISVSVSTSTALLVHNSHTSCCPSLWVTSLPDWIPLGLCYASCCCSFLCSVFIMSQACTTMSTTTTPSSDFCVLQYIMSPLNGYHGPLLHEASSIIRSA